MTIKKGDYIRDNDPRSPGRILRVLEVCGITYLKAQHPKGGRVVNISLSRVFEDEKHRRTGFSKVQP